MIQVRQVALVGGPFDGAKSISSGGAAWVKGELYVDGGDETRCRFVHVKTTLGALPERQQAEEKERVHRWMTGPKTPVRISGVDLEIPRPMSELIGIPPWRIYAWVEAIKNQIV